MSERLCPRRLSPFVVSVAALLGLLFVSPTTFAEETTLTPIEYGDSDLAVDLGVGLWAWPLPLDYDGDGDLDLLVSCPDVPHRGTFFFERPDDSSAMPVFAPAVRLSDRLSNAQISYVDGKPVVMTPAKLMWGFAKGESPEVLALPLPQKIDSQYKRIRANQWKLVDWEGDGDLDIVVGIGVWDDYGWDDAWDETGGWTNGPLHGYVYLIENVAQGGKGPGGKTVTLKDPAAWPKFLGPAPTFAAARRIEAAGAPVDVYGMPSPNLADFDGDGDLDLLCGEFLDGFTYFANEGTRTEPKYAAGVKLDGADGTPLEMDLQMITPVALDWDGDGDVDLICGDEDGRVAFLEQVGVEQGRPRFAQAAYFQQQAADVKFGALVTPVSVDWDGDGDEDIICGNSAGYLAFIENLTGGAEPRWAPPVLLRTQRCAEGGPEPRCKSVVIRQQAGDQGSIQGPCEAKWGYTTLDVADWNHDGLPDVIVNDIWGRPLVFSRTRDGGLLDLVASPLEVQWKGNPPKPSWVWWTPVGTEFTTQWRTQPCVVDWNEDGLNDLIMLDHEGYLAYFERARKGDSLVLLPPRRIFKCEGPCEFDNRQNKVGAIENGLLRLNAKNAGASGRRKLCMVDWDGDGRLDLLVNSVNVNWLRNVRTDESGFTWFRDEGPLDDRRLAGHTTSPTTVDWDENGIPDLLVGAEDGRIYYKPNPRGEAANSVISAQFIYEEAPFPECHASTIESTPTGLVASWFGGTREGRDDVTIWVSRHVDGKWSTPVEVADGVVSEEKRYPCWNPVLFQWPDGPLQLYYKVGPNPRDWWGMVMDSEDGGETWGVPRRLPAMILGPIKNKPVLLANGELLCGSSTEHDGWQVQLEITPHLGRSWERYGPIEPADRFNAIQPTILTHSDGRLQILCRAKEKNIVTSWSSDMGHTWSPLEPIELPNPNSGIDAVTLADGRHLLVYNHTPRGRSPLNVAVSDDGLAWRPQVVLEDEPGEYSYPAVIQAEDGLVHITYTWKRQRVKHVVLDPAKLK